MVGPKVSRIPFYYLEGIFIFGLVVLVSGKSSTQKTLGKLTFPWADQQSDQPLAWRLAKYVNFNVLKSMVNLGAVESVWPSQKGILHGTR